MDGLFPNRDTEIPGNQADSRICNEAMENLGEMFMKVVL